MKNNLQKYKIQLVIALYVLAVLAAGYFFIIPSVQGVADKAQQIQQQEIDHNLDKERIASLSIMEENYEKFKDNESDLNIIMDSFKEVDFIKELEDLAEQTNNKVEFRIQENADKKTVSKNKKEVPGIKESLSHSNYLSMQIALEGNYGGLLKFIYKLENFHNYVNIISISVEKKEMKEEMRSGDPFSSGSIIKKGVNQGLNSEVLNTIIDIVVYINPST